jgi:hypothetical protein
MAIEAVLMQLLTASCVDEDDIRAEEFAGY